MQQVLVLNPRINENASFSSLNRSLCTLQPTAPICCSLQCKGKSILWAPLLPARAHCSILHTDPKQRVFLQAEAQHSGWSTQVRLGWFHFLCWITHCWATALYCFLLCTALGIDSYLYTLWIFMLPHDWSKCQGGPTRAAKCNYPAGWNSFILNKLTGCLPQRQERG